MSLKSIKILKNVNYIYYESINFCNRVNKQYNLGFERKKLFPLKCKKKRNLRSVNLLIKMKKDFVMLSDSGIPCFVDPGSE